MEPALKLNLSEKSDWKEFIFHVKNNAQFTVDERADYFAMFLEQLQQSGTTYGRLITSPTDRVVKVKDPFTNRMRQMLMFASNNYLGFANHPYIKEKVKEAIDEYGVGVGGPPLLNGYTLLMNQLEQRLAKLKHQEAAMIFPTGYTTNVGLVTSLVREHDKVVFDELSHASFLDGLRMSGANAEGFQHNNLDHLESILAHDEMKYVNLFVAVEGVYSMDGDLAPLDQITLLCRKYGAYLILDDAHGTGVMGEDGSGTARHFNCQKEVDLTMGTFSKAFAMTGGFLAGRKELIDSIRFLARPYMFSAALPPVALAAVLAGLDLIEQKPELRENLLDNVKYAAQELRPLELCAEPEAAIISVKVPSWIRIRKLNYKIHRLGVFLNAIEYPAVAKDEQRLRISITTEHTKEDIDHLATVLKSAFEDSACYVPAIEEHE